MDAEGFVEAVTDELAGVLFGLDVGSLKTPAITRHITGAIAAWASSRGWSVRTEARVNVREGHPSGADDRLGFVDVVIRRDGTGRDIAIEIDSVDKPWSVAKLQHAAAAGMHAIWVRWGDDEWAGVYDDVDVIQLRLGRAPDRGSDGKGQLAFWPQRPARL